MLMPVRVIPQAAGAQLSALCSVQQQGPRAFEPRSTICDGAVPSASNISMGPPEYPGQQHQQPYMICEKDGVERSEGPSRGPQRRQQLAAAVGPLQRDVLHNDRRLQRLCQLPMATAPS
jgi:hypothetical protein